VGAYTYAFLASTWFGVHLPLIAIIFIGAIVTGVFGVAFGAPTLRLRGDYLAVVTLGFGEIVQLVLNNANGLTNGPQGIFGLDPASIAGIQLGDVRSYYWLLLIVVCLVALLTRRLQVSRLGRAWLALRSDESAARGSGVNTVRMKLLAFLIGAMIAGGAGAIFAAEEVFVSPQTFTIDGSILVLAMVLLGGSGSVLGAIAGAVVIGAIVEGLNSMGAGRYVLVGVVMAVVMVLRPRGLFGSRYAARLGSGRRRLRGLRIGAARLRRQEAG
jgi:branched-chain amino acid transport system permease protein